MMCKKSVAGHRDITAQQQAAADQSHSCMQLQSTASMARLSDVTGFKWSGLGPAHHSHIQVLSYWDLGYCWVSTFRLMSKRCNF